MPPYPYHLMVDMVRDHHRDLYREAAATRRTPERQPRAGRQRPLRVVIGRRLVRIGLRLVSAQA